MNETQIEALKKGAAVLYQTLQNIASLHESAVAGYEEGEEVLACFHCTTIAGTPVAYPCPTTRVVLNDFEIEEPEEEETPAE